MSSFTITATVAFLSYRAPIRELILMLIQLSR